MRRLIVLSLLLTGCADAGPSASPTQPAEHLNPTPDTWTQPTPRPPIDTAAPPRNISNMTGLDWAPAIAVHPSEPWAAISWVNTTTENQDNATVYVKVQDRSSSAWPRESISVNTRPARQRAGHPALAIDAQGRVHVVFGQGDNEPHYAMTADGGQSWSPPEPLPACGRSRHRINFSSIAVSPAGELLVAFVAEGRTCVLLGGPGRWAEATPLPGSWHITTALAFTNDGRPAVVAGCQRGCGQNRAVVATYDGGAWRAARIGGHAERSGWDVNWVAAMAVPRGLCVAWGYYARSGNYSSCSFDGGASWEDAKPVIETLESGTDDSFDIDAGATPALLYDRATDTLMAVQLYRQAGEPLTIYPVYSYRRLWRDHWVPDLAGPFRNHQPALRLFPATPRSHAAPSEGVQVAYRGDGLAWAVWAEVNREETMDVYAAQFHPGALLTEVRE